MQIERAFVNGKIITLDRSQPEVEALAVADQKIVAVGSTAEIMALCSPETEVVDLAGRTVVPGFNDSHMHLGNLGQRLEQVQLNGVRSRQELIEVSRAFLKAHPDVQWLVGGGWNHDKFDDRQLPTRHDLDQISTEIPILYSRTCGHIGVVNSRALEIAGLGQDPVQPAGGVIDVDENGMPTGILRESAKGLVSRHLPENSVADYKRYFQAAARQAASFGLTSVQSDDIGSGMGEKLQALRQLVEEDSLPVRVNLQVRLHSVERIEEYLRLREEYQFPAGTVEYGPLKLMTDGSLGGRTAALRAPYADDPSTCGVEVLPQEQINELLLFAHSQGLQMAGHAIGDRAMDMLLNGIENALNERPQQDARPRIIHAQITTPDILERMQRLGVVCDIQPGFVGTDLHIVESRVGAERMRHTYAWKTMRQMGIPTAGGSDCPVESCNPLIGIQIALTSQDLNQFPEGGWMPSQRLTLQEALELYTIGSAYASFDEDRKGTLSVGKLADMVVLERDLREVAPGEIASVRVLATYLGGRQVYQAE
ncbi:MAG: amidohydrolase [Bacillota bacterium]|jgi:predicted amidohydrolase YtcJ